MARLLLASGSPRRAELLAGIGVSFSRLPPPGIDETPGHGESPADYVSRMAREKASAGAAGLDSLEGVAVLGADTAVVHDNDILGKPADPDDARAMLRRLSGGGHRVMSAVALITVAGTRLEMATTEVEFLPLTESRIRRYVDTGEPMDKAGAYGIQGFGAAFVARIVGSYSNVVGLPLAETVQLLDWAEVPYWQDLRDIR